MSSEVVRLGATTPEAAPAMAAVLLSAVLAECPDAERADSYVIPRDHPTAVDLRRAVPGSPVWPFMDEHPETWLVLAVAFEP